MILFYFFFLTLLESLTTSDHELIQRQSAKALANLGVNPDNKRAIALKGGVPKLVRLAAVPYMSVKIEAIAALANLAVNDANEVDIVQCGGLTPVVEAMAEAVAVLFHHPGVAADVRRDYANAEELAAQCARALRNLSVNVGNKAAIARLGAVAHLRALTDHPNERIAQQAKRALRNLEVSGEVGGVGGGFGGGGGEGEGGGGGEGFGRGGLGGGRLVGK